MNDLLMALPVLIPLTAAAAGGIVWRSRRLQVMIAMTASLLHLAMALALAWVVWRDGIQVTQSSAWPAPVGISLVADMASAVLVVLAAFTGLTTVIYSIRGLPRQVLRRHYFPLLNVMLTGVCGSFLTGDIFNLYVWFEVVLIASFVLMGLAAQRPQLEGGVKYVTLSLLGSFTLLSAAGLLYGVTGTLNMAHLAVRIPEVPNQGLALAIGMMLMFAFAVKAAAFPVYFWLPASYHTPPPGITAIFAALLTKVGVYSMMRVFTLIYADQAEYTHTILLWVAGFTMVSGVLGAVAQKEMRRIFAYHSVSQVGYMLMGIALNTRLALAGAVLFIVHHSIVKSNLFLIAGVVDRIRGNTELDRMGGLYFAAPFTSILFLVTAGSLAGIPPLSGFAGKLYLVKAGLEVEAYWIVGVALGVSLLTLLSMSKIWVKGFMPDGGPVLRERTVPLSMWIPVAAMALLAILLGVIAEPVYHISIRAADDLLNREAYIRAVLGPEVAP
jgi:multicomponent Na+:H+ antiporter subunit D